MKQSFLATKTRRETPVDEVTRNAKLLIRAGYIHKTMAGIYSLLPLGLRAINNIIRIIREEMDAIGGQEMLMNSIQNPEVWRKSNRWDGESIWFRSRLNTGGDVGFAWTHEEPVTELMRHHVSSYRDLPLYIYQFQSKMRNEKRAKSGIMRTREFIMKDLYSFCADEKQHKEIYEQCAEAYLNVFARVGLGKDTYRTFADGGAFSDFSEEFQTVTPAGEDTIYLHREKRIAVNREVYTDETLKKLGLKKEELEKTAASEVGNIFTLGTKYAEPLDLQYTDRDGNTKPVYMGSYGIGVTRLLGVIAEKHGDGDMLVLPPSVAPFTIHLIALGEKRDDTDAMYQELLRQGTTVLYDDRNVSAGEKFADSDLIGIPHRLIISDKTRAAGKAEYRNRMTGEESMPESSPETILKML